MSGLEDILFENRNKEYGSYELRKKYPKYLFWGFILSIGIMSLTVGVLFVILNSDLFFQPKMPQSITVESLQLLNIQDLQFPEPPAVPKAQVSTDLTDLEIKDSVIKEEQKKKEVKNNSPQPKKDNLENKGKGDSGDQTNNRGDSLLYVRIDEMPEFEGGREAMSRFLREHLSESIKKIKTRMKIVVQFTVSKSGEPKEISIISGIDPLVDKEILRVLSIMPRWKPGRQGGRPIDVRFRLPINM